MTSLIKRFDDSLKSHAPSKGIIFKSFCRPVWQPENNEHINCLDTKGRILKEIGAGSPPNGLCSGACPLGRATIFGLPKYLSELIWGTLDPNCQGLTNGHKNYQWLHGLGDRAKESLRRTSKLLSTGSFEEWDIQNQNTLCLSSSAGY